MTSKVSPSALRVINLYSPSWGRESFDGVRAVAYERPHAPLGGIKGVGCVPGLMGAVEIGPAKVNEPGRAAAHRPSRGRLNRGNLELHPSSMEPPVQMPGVDALLLAGPASSCHAAWMGCTVPV